MKKIIIALISITCIASSVSAQLQTVASSDIVWNGVTVSDDGRLFVSFPRFEGDKGMRIGEVLKGNIIKPYPDADWNDWQNGKDVHKKIVRPNSLRIGPDGNLWIVDTGAPSLGADPLPGAAKLIVVNLKTNQVIRTISLGSVSNTHSFFDDLRIYKNHIFMTDAADPAIIVLDLKTGKGRRLLENHPAATDVKPLLAEGKELRTGDGQLLKVNADQLEVSPDGKWFYFQPVSGPLARIELKYLLDGTISKRELAAHVESFFKTPTTGGTAIDAAGNIYVSDVDKLQIIKITPDGKSSVIIKDPRLIWADAMWIDNQGFIYIPCGQINRLASFQNGKSQVKLPVMLYRFKTKSKPFRS